MTLPIRDGEIPIEITHGLISDKSNTLRMKIGCPCTLLGGLGLVIGIGMLLYTGFDKGFDRIFSGNSAVQDAWLITIITLIVTLTGVFLITRGYKLAEKNGYPIDGLFSDGIKIYYGPSKISWDQEATSKLENGHKQIQSVSTKESVEFATPHSPKLMLVIVVRAVPAVQVVGFGMVEGERTVFETYGEGFFSVIENQAWSLTDTVLGDKISVAQGLKRVREIQKCFPANVQTAVHVIGANASPTFGQVLTFGLIAGAVIAHFNAKDYNKKIDELMDKGLVLDKETGESLVSLCQEFSWTLTT